MNVLCFVPSSKKYQQLNRTLFNSLSKTDSLEVHRTLKSIGLRLRRDIHMNSVVILCPESAEHLQNFIDNSRSVRRARIIVVLPKNAADMAECIHKLSPSFILHEHQDFRTISEVVEKIRTSFQQHFTGDTQQEE